jgi:hypothetical protein
MRRLNSSKRSTITHHLAILLASILSLFASVQAFTPDNSLLRTYTRGVAAPEPVPPPCVAEFCQGDKHLYFLAARHVHEPSSPTFRLVASCFKSLPIDALIIEGLPRPYGISPSFYLPGTARGGKHNRRQAPIREGTYAAMKASQKGIPFTGGERTDPELHAYLKDKGFSDEDILGWYFTRQVPGEISIRKAMTVQQYYDRTMKWMKPRLGISEALPFDFQQFQTWYQDHNHEEFHADEITTDTTAPTNNGELFTQRVSSDVQLFRDSSALDTIASMLEKHDNVLIVYGAGHLFTQRLALEKMLGKPIRESKRI